MVDDDGMNFVLPSTDHIEAAGDFDPLPAGTYKVEIEATSIVKTRDEQWPMMKATLLVVEGDYAGRKMFDQFLLMHSNPKAEEIGLRKLKQIKLAVGKPQAEKESDLWGIPILAKVTIERDDQYGDKNRIQRFLPVNGEGTRTAPARPAASSQAAKSSAPAGAASDGKRSWRK